jgi:PAT family beta-lactamase induction signal transducer AmpG
MTYDAPQISATPILPGLFPSLEQSKFARFSAAIILYFMQGVPIGLGLVAIPAWLAANGATPVEVAAFAGTIILPWSLKLVNGLIMDRFSFKPMGRRRGWILIAQAAMTLTLFALAIAAPGPDDIAVLTVFMFILMLCATFNDVAVDGMVIDIVPEDERPLLNSLMFAAQSVGFASVGFIAAVLLADGAMGTAALVFGVFVAAASIFVTLFRERGGERLLPWAPGKASKECLERQSDAFWPVIKGVAVSTFKPLTLVFLLAMALAMGSGSFGDAMAATLAVQELGWESAFYSGFMSTMSLIIAPVAVLCAAPAVRAFGLRNAIFGVFGLHIAAALVGGLTLPFWQGDTIFIAVSFVQALAHTLTLVLCCVWLMHLCSPAVAASQFALFNAAPTLVRSFYTGNSGFVIEWGGYQAIYLAIAGLASLGMVALYFARVDNRLSPD